MKSKKGLALAAVASIPLVMTLGNSMLIPVLPTMEKALGITAFQSSLILTVYSIVAILLIPVAGYMSDRWGRKKIIIPSLIIAGIGGIISGYAAWKLHDAAFPIILVGRFFQGVGAAGAAPIVLPLVGDMFDSEEEVSSGLGTVETSNTFGKVLSPILGAALATVFWFFPFWAFPVFCLISIIAMMVFVKVPPSNESPPPLKEYIKSIKAIFKREGRWLTAVFFIGGLCIFVIFGVLFYLSTILEERYQIAGVQKGFVLAIPLMALCAASYFAGRHIKESKPLMKWVTFVGLLLLTAGVSVLAFVQGLYILLTALFISGIGIGAALPCLDALITEGIEKEQRGIITAVYSSIRFIGVAAAPPLAAILMEISQKSLFFTLAGMSFVGICCTLFIHPEQEQREKGRPKPNTI
ncbi:ACDE family multidrug resistance protein [Aureibacillus halotolerans]|uniref:ACDE family multidrug resistance protein n=1 Tax=Aureibacillus halotolerans TaxID=1508390 RepID=A0A4R6UFT6_9BACI|nr:MFS transporter [Aureibacillus halotolerans]TDQ42004.1 ACDE family multidrug resistance protein [Aureibacillus halotolerans]